MTTTTELGTLRTWLKTSITVRLAVIGFLMLLLLIPVALVTDLIDERYQRQQQAVREVSDKWAHAQTLTGPFITIPYTDVERVWDRDRNRYVENQVTRHTHLLPETLRLTGQVVPEVRYRGQYEVVVYRSTLRLEGSFSARALDAIMTDTRHRRGEATVGLGLSDLRGIQQAVVADWDGASLAFDPGLPTSDVADAGISASVSWESGADDAIPFVIPLDVNGSERLAMVPLGRESDARVSAAWPSPSFDGVFLPDDRTITDAGFSAHWNVLHVNRPYPQVFRGARSDVAQSQFGVSLLMPVDQYQQTTRAAKYAVLFIALTFLIYFFVQTLLGARVHPMQYLLVGTALCVFYTLLLSVAEHIGFEAAYAIASTAVITMIGLFSWSVFKRGGIAALVAGLLAGIYGFMFIVIQQETYALLMGSVGLFVVLGVVMLLSRRLTWYAADPATPVD